MTSPMHSASAAREEADRFDWSAEPLAALTRHVLERYHRPLEQLLPGLLALSHKVADVHGARHPELFDVRDRFAELRAELQPHMMKEEQILFPWIEQGRGYQAEAPIAVMRHDHQIATALLCELEQLTNEFQAPADACNSYRALYDELEKFDRELREHMRLENEVLFPRALAGANL